MRGLQLQHDAGERLQQAVVEIARHAHTLALDRLARRDRDMQVPVDLLADQAARGVGGQAHRLVRSRRGDVDHSLAARRDDRKRERHFPHERLRIVGFLFAASELIAAAGSDRHPRLLGFFPHQHRIGRAENGADLVERALDHAAHVVRLGRWTGAESLAELPRGH